MSMNHVTPPGQGLPNEDYSYPSQVGKSKKGPISCAECRRLKIKCDLPKLKGSPCSSCEKRGCGELCPDNALKTGKGTRYILSGTEELHKQVDDLRSRVRELEDALAASHSSNSNTVHELLIQDTHKANGGIIQRSEADDGRLHTEFDALMISDTGAMQWLGSTALSEWFVRPEGPYLVRPNPDNSFDQMFALNTGQTTETIVFDAHNLTNPQIAEYRTSALAALPPQEEYNRLVNYYYEQVAWFYNPVPRKRFDLLTSQLFGGRQDAVKSHELSSVYTILALGSLMDPNIAPYGNDMQRYASFGRLCLSLDCVFAQTTIATIEAYLLRIMYMLFSKDMAAHVKVFSQLGLIWRLIISMGMHRDPARWNFDEEECIRRRRLFWEFVAMDTWQSLSWGRPSSIDKNNFDCKMPWEDMEEPPGEEAKFQRWKFTFVKDIVMDLLSHSVVCDVLTLGNVMKIDQKVRDYQFPFDLASPIRTDKSQPALASVYQRNIMFCLKESTLLYLHRPFFVSALHENLQDPLRSRFAGSVLATHASASSLLSRSEPLLAFQLQTPRFYIWWTQGFSAAVVLACLVIRAPGCSLAPSSLTELEMALQTYGKASEGFRPGRLLPAVRKLHARANAATQLYRSGQWRVPTAPADPTEVLPGIISIPTVIPNAIFPTTSPTSGLTGVCSMIVTTSTPAQSPSTQNNVDNMVNSYLQALEIELGQLAKQPKPTPWKSADSGLLSSSNTGRDVFLPPQTSLLPLLPPAPPVLSEQQSIPMFDPTSWSSFLAQFGATPP